MTQLVTHQRTGISFAFIGGMVISFDVPMMLLAQSDPWLMVFFRGMGAAIIFALIYRFGHSNGRRWTQTVKRPWTNKAWVQVGILVGMNYILFTSSVFLTSTANLVFILAFSPMIAALLAWVWIGERPKPVTWIAILLTVVGVAIIIEEGLTLGTSWGDFSALGCACLLALAVTRIRISGQDMSLAPGLGGLLAALAVLPFALMWSPPPGNWAWLLANGFILVPIASFCLAIAPKYIPAPQVAMFYLFETVLAPVWVWMVFGEVPSDRVMLGGAIVLAAITGHSLWQLRKPPKIVTLSD